MPLGLEDVHPGHETSLPPPQKPMEFRPIRPNEGGGYPGPEELESSKGKGIERRDNAAALHGVAAQAGGKSGFQSSVPCRPAFYLNVEIHVLAQFLQDFFQERHDLPGELGAFPRSDVQVPQGVEILGFYLADKAAGYSLCGIVVENQEPPPWTRWTSSSIPGTPLSLAALKAAMVFSGYWEDNPLWANKKGRGKSERMGGWVAMTL